MTQRIRPPTHSSNAADNPPPEPPINVTADPSASAIRREAEGGLPERASAPDLVKGPADPNAINANQAQNLTLPPLEAIQARQAMNQPNRLGNPQLLQLNEHERCLLEYNEAKAALRKEYGEKRANSPEVEMRYERSKENMVRLGLLQG